MCHRPKGEWQDDERRPRGWRLWVPLIGIVACAWLLAMIIIAGLGYWLVSDGGSVLR